jgi:RNA polymerase sigma factor (sigma-70 family)
MCVDATTLVDRRQRLEAPPREWIDSARRGDSAAFARLIRFYERPALAIAYATLGDASAAGDVAQEAFFRAWQRIGELKEPNRFGAWLGRIVRNLATDHLRRRPREQACDEATMRLVQAPATDQAADQRQEIDAALATLDELTRSAVVLRYYQDLSAKQIAELLDLSPAAVDMRLSRARQQLREVLGRDSVKA